MLKAFILAAGESSRFAPYSRLLEKSMLPLGGKPVVRIIAERLTVAFAAPPTHPLAIHIAVLKKHEDAFKHEFRDMPNVSFTTLEEPLGTVSTFSYAAQLAGTQKDDDILLHYADTYTEINYAKMYDYYKSWKPEPRPMIAITTNIHHDYSEIWLDTGVGRVVKVVEKPKLHYPTWTGIAIFNYGEFRNLFAPFTDFGYDILPKWVEQHKLSAYMVDAPYYDTGNPRAYEQIRDSFTKASQG